MGVEMCGDSWKVVKSVLIFIYMLKPMAGAVDSCRVSLFVLH